METSQLKINFHQLIESIDNKEILVRFYDLMAQSKKSLEGKLWSRLTMEEQEELILSDVESEDIKNLIPHSTIQKKHNKWL